MLIRITKQTMYILPSLLEIWGFPVSETLISENSTPKLHHKKEQTYNQLFEIHIIINSQTEMIFQQTVLLNVVNMVTKSPEIIEDLLLWCVYTILLIRPCLHRGDITYTALNFQMTLQIYGNYHRKATHYENNQFRHWNYLS